MLKSIQQEWEGYSAMVFRGMDVGPVQYAETKQAFFAGSWSVLQACNEIGEPHITEEQGEQWLRDRQAECLAFKDELIRRYSESN